MSRHDGKVWVRKLRSHYSTHPWEVRARNLRGYDYYETFYSWREALVEADRLARTVEVTLPRIAPQGEVTVSATWDYDQQSIHYINPAGATVQGTPADLRPLAGALLALAEQEESCRE